MTIHSISDTFITLPIDGEHVGAPVPAIVLILALLFLEFSLAVYGAYRLVMG